MGKCKNAEASFFYPKIDRQEHKSIIINYYCYLHSKYNVIKIYLDKNKII